MIHVLSCSSYELVSGHWSLVANAIMQHSRNVPRYLSVPTAQCRRCNWPMNMLCQDPLVRSPAHAARDLNQWRHWACVRSGLRKPSDLWQAKKIEIKSFFPHESRIRPSTAFSPRSTNLFINREGRRDDQPASSSVADDCEVKLETCPRKLWKRVFLPSCR